MKPYAELSQIAERVKRATTNTDVLDLCDAVLERSPLLRTPPVIPDQEAILQRTNAQARARMRRWRVRKKAKDDAKRPPTAANR